MIGIVIVLVVFIIIIAVLIIHATNKYSAWYFYLSYMLTSMTINNVLKKCLGQTFCCTVHRSKDSYKDFLFYILL